MSCEYKEEEIDISSLCTKLEWRHQNAIRAAIRGEKTVELSDKERSKLWKLLSLQGRKGVKITGYLSGTQKWYRVYVDDILVASAYVDYHTFAERSWWDIHQPEFDDSFLSKHQRALKKAGNESTSTT